MGARITLWLVSSFTSLASTKQEHMLLLDVFYLNRVLEPDPALVADGKSGVPPGVVSYQQE